MTIKDSGNRSEFSTGAVRDIQKGKGRCDLLPLHQISQVYSHTNRLNGAIIEYIARVQDAVTQGDDKKAKEYVADVLIMFAAKENKDKAGSSLAKLFLEVSKHYEEGAEKYGERNWEKGLPIQSYLNSGIRHFLKHIANWQDERHDRAFTFNMLGIMFEIDRQRRSNA